MMTLDPQKTYHLPRGHRRPPSRPTLRLVPMIDVIFQLLIFFMIGANFRSQEGFLPAELPRQVVHAGNLELEPLPLYLNTQADGSCFVQIGTAANLLISSDRSTGLGFDQLSQKLLSVLEAQGRNCNDPVKLMPSRQTKWDHVVKAYDALWKLNLRNIIFAMVD